MSALGTSRVVIQCDGAAVPTAFTEPPDATHHRIVSQGDARDLDLQIQDLYRTVLTQVSPRHADLVRLAAYVYRADQMVSRGGSRDSDGRAWKRQLVLCVPMTDPAFWDQEHVKQALNATLAFLTDDQWLFAFSRWDPPLQQIQLHVSAREMYQRPSVITLFSGGIDSLCALIEAAMQGERPVAVGHWSAPPHQARQKRLMDAVHQLNHSWTMPLQGVRILRRGAGPADNSQRTRGFLFGCLGSAIAAEVGAPRVYLADNGPISLNLPINEQLVGALASRATHPQFLERLNRFLRLVLESPPVIVSNPLQSRTRAETLEILKDAHAESLLPLTLSCSNWSRLPAATPHCGGCSQCVDRRFATIAAGLAHLDPVEAYAQDVFLEPLTPWDRAMTALSYVRFARRVYPMSQTDFLTAFPQLLDIPAPDDPHPDGTMLDAIDLVKRHATTVLGVLEQQTVVHLSALIAGRVPAASLLSQVLAEQQGRRRRPPKTAEPVNGSTTAPELTRVSPSPRVSVPTTNVFAWNGNGWQVVYGNEERVLSKSIGLTRLACLLREPHRAFSPEQLELAAHGHAVDTPDRAFEHGELSLASIISGDYLLDGDGVKLFKNAIAELEQDRQAAIAVGEIAQARALEEQRSRLEQALKASRGRYGRLRTVPTSAEKHHRAVYRSLRRALEAIEPVHRPFYQHLKTALHTESRFCYAPEPPLDWDVQLPPPEA